MGARKYRNFSIESTLTGSINASVTTCSVVATTNWPTSTPFDAVIDYGTASAEAVTVTNVSGTTLTITRAVDGTSASSHTAGAKIQPMSLARDFSEANTHINTSSGVHGLSGAVVGTTDVQTLTNKTLTSPVISGPTVSGTLAAASITASGTVTVTGAMTGGSLASNSTISGATLAVTGAAVVAGTLSAGATTVASVGVSGNATVTGTLNVTGAATFGTAGISNANVTALAATAGTVSTTPASGNDIVNKTYADNIPIFAATQAVTQSLTHATWTPITFTTEDIDTDNGHSTSSNTSRYVVAKAGTYRVTGCVVYASNGSGVRYARLTKNGTPLNGSWRCLPASAVDLESVDTSITGTFAVNDYIEIQGHQTSGASLSTAISTEARSMLCVEWQRP